MKGSLMKLNRVSTFSGEGQVVITRESSAMCTFCVIGASPSPLLRAEGEAISFFVF